MTARHLFTFIAIVCSVCSHAQINDIRTPDTTKKEVVPIKSGTNPVNVAAPIKSDTKPQTNPLLNGYYVLYNRNKQKTKDGTFVDNHLKDGKNYIYDDKGVLVRIELYKDFKYVGDTTEK